MRRARTPAAVVALVALLAGLTAPVAADPRREREQARARKAQVAKELDALSASDQELESAVADLDAHITTQSATVAAARQAVEAAEAELAEAERRLAATRARMEELRTTVVERAVAAYIRPGQEGLNELVASRDMLEASRKQAMLAHLAGRDNDLLDALDAAEEDEVLASVAAEEAAVKASERRDEAEHRLAELNESRAEKARLQQALEVRIREFQAEADALASQEAQLTRIIAEQEAAVRAEAARRAAAEAASRAAAAAAAASRSASRPAARSASSSGGATTPQAAPTTRSASGLIWPTRGRVTSGFGQRWGRLHAGLDIAAPTGTPIYAAAAGTVIYSGTMSGYGNVVMIDHGSMTTVYAHQSRIAAGNGRRVAQGELIGYVGSTGRSTGPHLHFETRVGGSPRNPAGYL